MAVTALEIEDKVTAETQQFHNFISGIYHEQLEDCLQRRQPHFVITHFLSFLKVLPRW